LHWELIHSNFTDQHWNYRHVSLMTFVLWLTRSVITCRSRRYSIDRFRSSLIWVKRTVRHLSTRPYRSAENIVSHSTIFVAFEIIEFDTQWPVHTYSYWRQCFDCTTIHRIIERSNYIDVNDVCTTFNLSRHKMLIVERYIDNLR
jgi:hypothetical protein